MQNIVILHLKLIILLICLKIFVKHLATVVRQIRVYTDVKSDIFIYMLLGYKRINYIVFTLLRSFIVHF